MWTHAGYHADLETGAPSERRVAPGKRTLTAQLMTNRAARTSTPVPAAGGGGALPAAIVRSAAAVLGEDVAGVRVHLDGQADALAAQAFAFGDELHFAAGAYQPETPAGVALIGHELAHVAQQRGGRVAADAPAGEVAINTDPGLEAEADRVGAALAQHHGAAGPVEADAPANANAAAAETAPAAIQGFGLPWLGLPGCAPAPADAPVDDVAATKRWEQGRARFVQLYNAGLAFVPPANEVEPSTDTLFRNTCEWIRDGHVTLTLLSLAAAPRQTADNDQYIGDGLDYRVADPKPAVTVGGYAGTWGNCDGTTMRLVDLMAAGWTDDYIKGTLIHEIQHDADKGPGAGKPFSRDPATHEKYQSEFRARWLEPDATADYGDPNLAASNDDITYDDTGTERTMPGVGFDNARQKGIFAELVRIGGKYYGTFAHDFLTNHAFKAMVLGLKQPAGGNLVNSVRIDDLATQITAGASDIAVVTAAVALDVTDCRALADRARAADFWQTAAALPPATLQQVGAVVDHPGTYRAYEVVTGDTLSLIAQRELGDLARWHEIYDQIPANQTAVGAEPDVITPTTALLLPPR